MTKSLIRAIGFALATLTVTLGIAGTATAVTPPQNPTPQSVGTNVLPIIQTTVVSFKNTTNEPVTVSVNSYFKSNILIKTITRTLAPGQLLEMGAGQNEKFNSDDVNGTITYQDGTSVFFRAASPWGLFRSPWAGFGHGSNYARFEPLLNLPQATDFKENGKSFTISRVAGNSLAMHFLYTIK